MCMLDSIRERREQLYAIADRNNVDKLYLFGSCARKEETADSDVDFLARFRPGASLFDQIGIINDFQSFLRRKVDVISTRSLKSAPRFANQVMRDLIAL